ILRSTNNGAFTALPTTAAPGATSFVDNTVVASTSYAYEVVATNPGGDSAIAGPKSVTTPAPPPAAPTNLAAAALSATSVKLTWTDNSTTETGFKILRSTNGGAFTLLPT